MAGTQPEHPMILGNCISCNGLMRVPVTTDVTHVARCPHCEIRFPVQQLIASAIPAAEIIKGVVSDEITPIVDRVREHPDDKEKTRTKFEVPKQLHDGAKHRRRRRRRSRGSDERKDQAIKDRGRPDSSRSSSGSSRSKIDSPSRAKIDAASVPLAATQSVSSAEKENRETSSVETSNVGVLDKVPMPSTGSSQSRSTGDSYSSESSSRGRSASRSSESRSDSRRSSSHRAEETSDNAIVEWLKIAVGGMLALPLAYLGLMWIAGLDPFQMANRINKVAPVLVPSSMVDQEALPLSEEDEIELDDAEGLPKPSIDPDEVRG